MSSYLTSIHLHTAWDYLNRQILPWLLNQHYLLVHLLLQHQLMRWERGFQYFIYFLFCNNFWDSHNLLDNLQPTPSPTNAPSANPTNPPTAEVCFLHDIFWISFFIVVAVILTRNCFSWTAFTGHTSTHKWANAICKIFYAWSVWMISSLMWIYVMSFHCCCCSHFLVMISITQTKANLESHKFSYVPANEYTNHYYSR